MGKGIKGEEIKKRGNKNQILRGDDGNMEFGSIILHNVESLIRDEEAGDYLLCRVPEPTRLGLNMKAQKNILFASNSEIRFVMKGDSAVLGLRRMPAKGDIRSQGVLEVFQGITREAAK